MRQNNFMLSTKDAYQRNLTCNAGYSEKVSVLSMQSFLEAKKDICRKISLLLGIAQKGGEGGGGLPMPKCFGHFFTKQ